MDFTLSDHGVNLMEPVGKPAIEKVDVDGEEMRAYVFKDRKLMSPGVWNGLYYSPDQLQLAYNGTDWMDARNVALFADHDDLKTGSWIGYVRNQKMDGEHLTGDLVVVDNEFAKKLTFGAKFGISPKIKGQRVQDSIMNASFENFSVVTDPACKTTWLNSQKKDDANTTDDKSEDTNTMAKEETEQPKEEAKPQAEASQAAEDKTEEVVKTLADSITSGMKEVSEGMKAGFEGISTKLDSLAEQKLAAEEPPEEDKPEENDEDKEDEVDKKEEKVDEQPDEPEPASVKGTEDIGEVEIKNCDVAMAKYMESLDGTQNFELSLEPDETDKSKFMSFTLASTATSVSSTRGSAISGTPYRLNPIIWAKSLIDAGKIEMKMRAAVREAAVPKGNKTLIMPIRKAYEDTWESSSEEYAIDTNITATEISDVDGVEFTPTRYNFRIGVTNKNLNTNGVNLMSYFREELAYKWAKDVDEAVASALVGATDAADGVPNAMDLYGGDATTTATLAAGDTLDTDMIAEGIKLLESKFNYYWTGGVLTKDTTLKNPWNTDGANPVLLYVAPEQMEDLRTDSRFVNASEYGNNRPLLSGEIGEYLGVKIIKSNSTPAYANFGGGAVDGHKCLMVKSRMCGGLAWGQKPSIKAFDWPIEDKKMMTLNLEYGTGILHGDAIVRLNVTDA